MNFRSNLFAAFLTAAGVIGIGYSAAVLANSDACRGDCHEDYLECRQNGNSYAYCLELKSLCVEQCPPI